GDRQLQKALVLTACQDRLIEGDLRRREAGGLNHLKQAAAEGVIHPPRRAQPAPQVSNRAECRRRLAPCRGQVAVLTHQYAVRLEQGSHPAQGSFRLREVEQEEAAIDEVER